MTPFCAYLRTSTDDHQSPEDSKAWQLRLAGQLIGPAGGEITTTYHDIDQSRSLPWERRPEAARLLSELPNPSRGWNDLVIAEPQRAFAGNQFGLVFPVLVHYGINLWVPEVGGRVDPDSEAHDLLMSLFGGLAKAERNRIRHRVRAAMAAHASAGRWLGGRPPYGYRLIDAGAHPNPDKAASGARLHRLDEDPDTSPVVARIFDLYVNGGQGFKAIATVLTADGIASPSAHDPTRNPNRPGHAWAASAVRAILANPRYLGRQVYGRQKREERLLDPTQPALGHATRMTWQPGGDWVISDEVTHPALVDEILWRQAQALVTKRGRRNGGGSPGPRRSEPGRYALAGLITCHHCTRRMQGNHARGHAFYRCRLTTGDYATAPDGHPPSLAVREDRLLPVIDGWLVDLFAPDRIEDTANQIVDADRLSRREHHDIDAARRTIIEARRKIDRHLAALEAGVDPALVATRTRAAQTELAAAQAILDRAHDIPAALTFDQVIETLQLLHEVPTRLDGADPATRADIYRTLNLQLAYRREENTEYLRLRGSIPGVDLERVGGGT